MLELKDFMPINFLKKEKFTGSSKGMRFRMEKREQEGEEMALAVTVWPEPCGYDATPKEEREEKLFSFDSDGIAQGVSWINERLETEADRWRKANESWR